LGQPRFYKDLMPLEPRRVVLFALLFPKEHAPDLPQAPKPRGRGQLLEQSWHFGGRDSGRKRMLLTVANGILSRPQGRRSCNRPTSAAAPAATTRRAASPSRSCVGSESVVVASSPGAGSSPAGSAGNRHGRGAGSRLASALHWPHTLCLQPMSSGM
jgi:hypothetical protein